MCVLGSVVLGIGRGKLRGIGCAIALIIAFFRKEYTTWLLDSHIKVYNVKFVDELKLMMSWHQNSG